MLQKRNNISVFKTDLNKESLVITLDGSEALLVSAFCSIGLIFLFSQSEILRGGKFYKVGGFFQAETHRC